MSRFVDGIRTRLPAELRVAVGNLRRARRVERATVRSHLDIPSSLSPAPRRPGTVWAIAMMHNESDTVRHVVEHMFRQGVDAAIVADNESTDDTADVLAELSRRLPLHVARDRLIAYNQGSKMTELAAIARRSGADWIVPFDADELWFAHDTTVADHLRAAEATVVYAALHNVFPAHDDTDDDDPFLRLRHIDRNPAPFRKVAFRTHALARMEMGNLDVARRGRRVDGLYIAHFPWRSFDQMTDKLRHGRRAMEETTLPAQLCEHWRIGGAWPDDRLAAAWSDLLHGRRVDDLAWSPDGPLRLANPGTAATWRDILDRIASGARP